METNSNTCLSRASCGSLELNRTQNARCVCLFVVPGLRVLFVLWRKMSVPGQVRASGNEQKKKAAALQGVAHGGVVHSIDGKSTVLSAAKDKQIRVSFSDAFFACADRTALAKAFGEIGGNWARERPNIAHGRACVVIHTSEEFRGLLLRCRRFPKSKRPAWSLPQPGSKTSASTTRPVAAGVVRGRRSLVAGSSIAKRPRAVSHPTSSSASSILWRRKAVANAHGNGS
jgi:hypothetical protein